MATFFSLASSAALLLLLLVAPSKIVDAGAEIVADIPEPNLREGCSPRCVNTADEGQYRCDIDASGNLLCNTFELSGPHTCHFHYYTADEVAQCMAEKRSSVGSDAPYTLIIMGSSILMGSIFTVAPWLVNEIDSDFDYQPWMFDPLPPQPSANPMDNCAQMVLDAQLGLVAKKADVNESPECVQVYEHSMAGDSADTGEASFLGDASIVWASAPSPDKMQQQLDLLTEAGRDQDHGHMVLYLGLWYTFCLQGREWACNILPEGAALRVLRGESLAAQVSFFEGKYATLVQRILSDFPNYELTITGLRRYSDITRAYDDTVRQLAASRAVNFLNLDGTTQLRPHQPDDISNHPPHVVNHSLFQRYMAPICEGTSVGEAQECEEEMVGSPGCQTETYDNPDGRWFEQYSRGCDIKTFTSPLGTVLPPAVLFSACPLNTPNLFLNPNLDESLVPWTSFALLSAGVLDASITHVTEAGDGGARFTINTAGTADWHMQLFQVLPPEDLTLGETMTVSFEVTAEEGEAGSTRAVFPYIQQLEAPWRPFVSGRCEVRPSGPTTCSVTATLTDVTVPVKFGIQGGASDVDFTVHGASLCRTDDTVGSPVNVLFVNPDFTDGPLSNWVPFVYIGSAPGVEGAWTFSDDGAELNILAVAEGPTESWHAQMHQDFYLSSVGVGTYMVAFEVSAPDGDFPIDVYAQQSQGPYRVFGSNKCMAKQERAWCVAEAEVDDVSGLIKFGAQGGDNVGKVVLHRAALSKIA